jgi:hypothetical protein
MSTSGNPTAWVWEFLDKGSGTVLCQDVYNEEADALGGVEGMKALIGACFTDFQLEEVERRGIRGSVILVKRYGAYEDTGHWIFPWPQPPVRPAVPRHRNPTPAWRS